MAEQITPLNYGTLRMIAECAAGIGSQSVEFVATNDHVMWIPAATPQPSNPQNVLIPGRNVGHYPAAQLNMALSWTSTPSGTPVSGSIVAGPGGTGLAATADAVFWGDSAVQKFVVPYAASCAAWNAGTALTELQNAWNHYPPDKVAVFALLHLVPEPDAAVSLQSSLAFALADESQVTTMTLATYLEQNLVPVHSPEPDPTVSYEQVVPEDPVLYPSYRLLRGMAEWAASLNQDPAFFGWTPGQRTVEQPSPEPADFAIPAFTHAVPPTRPSPLSVTFTGADGIPVDLTRMADAVFWSQGSVQQFMLPYYASVGGFPEPDIVPKIIAAWWLDGSNPDGVVVDGLVHLPNSAWVEEREGLHSQLWQSLPAENQAKLRHYHATHVVSPFAARAHVGVLHRDVWGRHLLTLEDFMVLYPQYFV
ncbi:MAG TPA: hypothetical protein VHG08_05190 [Longimicrobium sp.]|nr:hypothetical protein [Longimicrobium sp.]